MDRTCCGSSRCGARSGGRDLMLRVFRMEVSNIPGAKAQPRQEEEDCPIPQACRRGDVTGCDDALDRGRAEEPRQRCIPSERRARDSLDELGAAGAARGEKPQIGPQHRRRLPRRLTRAARRLVQNDLPDRDGVIGAGILTEPRQPARRLGDVAYDRLVRRAAPAAEPGPERREARIFRGYAGRMRQTPVPQELEKRRRAATPAHDPGRGQRAAFAAEETPAVVLGEALDHVLIGIPGLNAREAKPVGEMLRIRKERASGPLAVAHS